eukprot:1147003-Pelagomonas_calceolata.AAC.4
MLFGPAPAVSSFRKQLHIGYAFDLTRPGYCREMQYTYFGALRKGVGGDCARCVSAGRDVSLASNQDVNVNMDECCIEQPSLPSISFLSPLISLLQPSNMCHPHLGGVPSA